MRVWFFSLGSTLSYLMYGLDISIRSSCMGYWFYVSYILERLLARINRIDYMGTSTRCTILVQLFIWKDKPIALSIVQARLVGLFHFGIGYVFTYAAFVIGSTSSEYL